MSEQPPPPALPGPPTPPGTPTPPQSPSTPTPTPSLTQRPAVPPERPPPARSPYGVPPPPPSGTPPWTPSPGGPGGTGGTGGPKPSQTRLLLGIGAIVAALVIVFCVTAFAAPGFLVDDDSSSARADGPADDVGAGSASAVLETVVEAFDDTDTVALEELACSGATPNVAGAIGSAGDVSQADLGDVTEESDTEVAADLVVTVDGADLDFTLVVADPGDGWCWQDLYDSGEVSPPSTGAPTFAPTPTRVVREHLLRVLGIDVF